MLYYGDAQREIDPRAVLKGIAQTLSEAGDGRSEDGYGWAPRHHAGLVSAAVALGEIHQAVAKILSAPRRTMPSRNGSPRRSRDPDRPMRVSIVGDAAAE